MDAKTHLLHLGWSGPGTSLDPHNRGLKHPLLISKKTSNTGIGLSGWNAHVGGGAWWESLYERGARAGSAAGAVSATATAQKGGMDDGGIDRETGMEKGRLWGVRRGGGVGLYGRFVRGEGLGGTAGKKMVVGGQGEEEENGEGKSEERQRRRERRAAREERRNAREERRAAREEKRRRKAESRSTEGHKDDEMLATPPASDDGARLRHGERDGEGKLRTISIRTVCQEENTQLPSPDAELSETEEQAKGRRKAERKMRRERKAAHRAERIRVLEMEKKDGSTECDSSSEMSAEEAEMGSKAALKTDRQQRKEMRKEQRAGKEERRRRKAVHDT